MMRTIERVTAWVVGAWVSALLCACANQIGEGSETHFAMCRTSAECRPRVEVCVASVCEPRESKPTPAGDATSNSLMQDSGTTGAWTKPSPARATGEAYAYFYASLVQAGAVYAVPKGAGTSVLLAHGTLPGDVARALTFDANSTYYSAEDGGRTTLYSLPRSGEGARKALATGLDYVQTIAVDATSLYFIDHDANGLPTTSVRSVPLSSGSPEVGSVATIVPAGRADLGGLAVYGDYVYWVRRDGDVNNPTAVVQRAPKRGGSVETIATGGINPRKIYVDGSGVYWLNEGHDWLFCESVDGDVRYLPPGSSTPIVIVSDLGDAGSFAVVDGSLIVTVNARACNNTQGSIVKVDISSGTVATLAPNVWGPDQLYVDGSDLYYTVLSDPQAQILAPAMLGL